MHNENQTAGTEQDSQDQVEAILKLAYNGLSPDAISSFFGLNTQMVRRVIANDPMHRAREVQLIKERSAEYRCAQSNRLMISPVMAHDENFYEQSILEADPSLSRDQFIPSKKLKAKIADFSKESLKVLEVYLRQKDPQEDILQLTAECLSVVIPHAGLESALRVLGAVERETLRKLTGKLRSLVPEEMLFGLMSQLAPSHALCLAALIIQEPRSEKALEEAFRCFAELLSQVALDAEAIDLVEEVSERLNSSQQNQINPTLEANSSEGGRRLDGLRLKEAYALLREAEFDAAVCLVNTLRISPRLEKEVLRFYDEAGLSGGKVLILEQRLSAKLVEISRDSPSLAEALSILHQLHKAELQSHKPEDVDQCLISQKAEDLNETVAKLGQQTSYALIAQDARILRLEEQTQREEADDQETLTGLRAEVEALTEELVKAGQSASETQIAQDARIQRLEEQAQRKEADDQETLSSLRAEADALTELLVKAGEEISQVKRAQDTQIQRLDENLNKSEAATQECLISLRAELRALHEQTAQLEEEAKRVQSFIELSQKADAATQNDLSSLRGEVVVLNKDVAQVVSQCKRAQSANEATLQVLQEQFQLAEAATQRCLSSCKESVEALTEEHLKAGQEIKQIKGAQDAQIQILDENLNKAEAATQECLISLRAALHEQTAISEVEAKRVQSFIELSQKADTATQNVLSSLRGEVVVLNKDLAQVANQCKRRAQSDREVALQMIEGNYQKAKAAAQKALNSLRGNVQTLTEGHLKAAEVEAATQQTLNGLWRDVGTLQRDLEEALSQCKQVQEAMLQRFEEQSQKTEANALKLRKDLAVTKHSLQDTREDLYHLHEITLPTFIYSYKELTDQLHRTNLLTGEQSIHQVPSYTFKRYCCWSEVPGGSLLITGGGFRTAVREVVRIDVGTFEVSPQRNMLTPRSNHTAVYHTPHVYILGGYNDRHLSECERYECANNRWEALPRLPRACCQVSGVVIESNLYALGGANADSFLDLVQRLSLVSLTWELMQLRLPYEDCFSPCFKLRDTEVYLVVKNTLCSFTGLEIRPLKTLTVGIKSLYGASYYRRGTLYCSNILGAVYSHEIGRLNTE
jgi:hypothetical protein